MDLNVCIQLIFVCVVNTIFTFSGIVFKHIGDSKYLEIVTTSKETVPFHDHVVVVLRFGRSRNE